ncbi:MAG: sigma-54-dependent transcriptional regulator [bacterium]
MGKVLIVDDSEDLRFSLSNVVKKEGYAVFTVPTGAEALNIVNSQVIDLVFLDLGLPDMNGLHLIPELKNISADLDIVILTGTNDAQTAVTALKAGAIDYIVKPFDIVEFRNILDRIMKNRVSVRKSLAEGRDKSTACIIGESRQVEKLKEEIAIATGVKAPVLITGETGTGKELVARAIFGMAKNKNGIFVKVDCSTLSPTIIESELFGYEKGAFTDAKADKKGLVEIADGGTLFLDEIGTLSMELQPKLLRLIEESTFRRVGGLKDIHVDVRIIAATNLNLEQEVRKGAFREDLYYRLKVMSMVIPPLRERGKDMVMLIEYFLGQFNHELKKQIRGFTKEAEAALLSYSWPGNIRELKNCIERAAIYCKGEWITPDELNITKPVVPEGQEPEELLPLEEMERRYILKVLASVGDNKTLAAKVLGISRTTLREKLKDGNILTD